MKIKIHVFHTGTVGVDPAVPFRDTSKNPIAYMGIFQNPKRRIWLPVSAYLIEHPKGRVLVDTEWHRDVRTNPKKHMSWKLHFVSKAKFPKGETIDEQLLKLGIKPQDLDYVFLSHMDVDHVSGVSLVKDAKQILISKEELDAVNKGEIRYYNRLFKDVNIDTFEMESSKYGPFKRSYDVFGDESVLMVDVAGHSKGTVATLIQNNGKFVLLIADCGYAKDSWESMRLPGPISDKNKMIKTLQWVRNMAHNENCIKVIANHDPEIKSQTIEL